MRSVEGVGIGSERDSVDDEDDQLLVEEMAAPVSVKGVRLWTSRQSWFFADVFENRRSNGL